MSMLLLIKQCDNRPKWRELLIKTEVAIKIYPEASYINQISLTIRQLYTKKIYKWLLKNTREISIMDIYETFDNKLFQLICLCFKNGKIQTFHHTE